MIFQWPLDCTDVEKADPGGQHHDEGQNGKRDGEFLPTDMHQTAFRGGAASKRAKSVTPPAR